MSLYHQTYSSYSYVKENIVLWNPYNKIVLETDFIVKGYFKVVSVKFFSDVPVDDKDDVKCVY